MNELIKIVLEEGVLVIDVYNMVFFNIVKYYQMDDFFGVVGLGWFVLLNIFDDFMNLDLVMVIFKGILLREDG